MAKREHDTDQDQRYDGPTGPTGQPLQDWDPQQHGGLMPNGKPAPANADPAETVGKAGEMQADGKQKDGLPNT